MNNRRQIKIIQYFSEILISFIDTSDYKNEVKYTLVTDKNPFFDSELLAAMSDWIENEDISDSGLDLEIN